MRIAEVAKLVGVSPGTLRGWERAGVVPPVPRSALGWREYDAAAVRAVQDVIAARIRALTEGDGACTSS